MLSLHSSSTSTHTILSYRLSLLPRLLLSLSSPSLKPKPTLSLNPNPNYILTVAMSSSRPSAFDFLMSRSRAASSSSSSSAAAKIKPTAANTSSPKKRKTLGSDHNPSPTKPINSEPIDDFKEIKPTGEQLIPGLSKQDDKFLNKSRKTESPPNTSFTKTNPVNETAELKPTEEPKLSNPSNKTRKKEDLETPSSDPVMKKAKFITADESVALLRKKPANFDPRKAAFWGEGERVPFLFLVKVFDAIDKESGRIVITDIVCNMLRTVIVTTPDDLLPVVYLLANKIAPAHEGVELGIGDASIIKALAEACGSKEAQIKSKYKELGDLGLVAKECRSSQSLMRRPEPLTVVKVFDKFRVIAKESGKDSQDKKKNHIKGLLVAATDCEPQYLIRLLQSKLRIGLAEQTLLVALGHAAVYAEKHSSSSANTDSPLEEAAKLVKQVYSVIPVYDKIVPALLSDGVWNLPKACSFTPGVPIGPMLSKPTKGVSEILDKFQDMVFTCEFKYDGERAQIHYLENGSVEIYSRNAERNTGKFPDVVAVVSRLKRKSIKSFVLDCEIVGYDREKNKILPFQILSTRARKNVLMSEIKVEVCIFAFDILYLNGQPLMQDQLDIRRKHLYESFEEETGYFQFATAITSNDLEEIQKFLDTSVGASCEGLIIKTLSKDATYEPAKRSNNWLKLKKDYMESIGDSLDLVPIAAFHGRGKRTGVFGAFLLACYDSSNEEFQSICKIGTGFSEAVLEERSTSLRSKVIPKPKPYYCFAESINPDVWFEPSQVWEVKAADLTISPVYRAAVGIVDNNKGISLRFPRLLRVREDKTPEEASSSEMVAEMYSAQKNTQRNNNQVEDDED